MVAVITPEIDAMGGEPPPGYSSGGMRTKLVAARIATQSGVAMAIALGHRPNPLAAIEAGAPCTWFLPAPEGRSARKNWIAGHLAPQGALTIDDGAARALAKGSSLLPAGITAVSGSFERGDAVDVLSPTGALGPRPRRLFQRRRRHPRRASLGGYRDPAGISRAR